MFILFYEYTKFSLLIFLLKDFKDISVSLIHSPAQSIFIYGFLCIGYKSFSEIYI